MTAVELLFSTPNVDAVKATVLSLIPIFDRVARSGKTAVERAAKDEVRAREDASRQIAKDADKGAKDATRSTKDAEREKQGAINETSREIGKAIREQNRIRNAENQLEVRDWQQKERAKRRISEQESRAARATLKRRSRAFGQEMGGATGRVMGMAGRVAGVATALGGGFAVADSLRAGIEQEKQAGVIFRGATNVGDFKNQGQVQQLAQQTAISTGGNSLDILGGLDMFVRKTGDLGVAKSLLEDLAKLSAATGTNFADMGNTAAEVQNQLGNAAQTMEVMRALAGQGKAGAIDIKDLGQYGGRLAASAAQFAGPLAGNIESFGAIAQLAKKLGGATDTAEATESVARLSSDFAKHEDAFKAAGVSVYADKGKTKFRSAEDIITESVVKTGGNQGKLREMFGERSIRAALGAQVAYSNAGGGAGGEAAIREQFNSLRATTMTQGQIDEGVKGRLAENEAKLNIATEQFHASLNDRLLPLLPNVIDKFTQLIPAIQRVIDFFVGGSVWEGLGKAAAVAMGLEIAKAGVSLAVRSGFSAIASQVLKMFAGTTAATATVNAGIVNVIGGGSTGNLAKDVVETAAGAGTAGIAAAGAGLSGLALTGLLAGGAAVQGGVLLKAHSDEKKGQDALANLMSLPESSSEEKQTKLAKLQDAVSKSQEDVRPKSYYGMGQFGGTVSAPQKGLDLENEAYRRQLSSVTAEIESLKASLSGAPAAIVAFTDSLKTAGERPDVPTGHHINQAP